MSTNHPHRTLPAPPRPNPPSPATDGSNLTAPTTAHPADRAATRQLPDLPASAPRHRLACPIPPTTTWQNAPKPSRPTSLTGPTPRPPPHPDQTIANRRTRDPEHPRSPTHSTAKPAQPPQDSHPAKPGGSEGSPPGQTSRGTPASTQRVRSMTSQIAWAYVVSNHGPLPCEGSALPLSYTPLRVVGPPYTAAIRAGAGGPAGRIRRCPPSRPVSGLGHVRRDWPRLRTTRTGKAQGGTALAGWPDARGNVRTLRMVIIRPPAVGVHPGGRPIYDLPGKGSPFRAGQLARTAVTDVVLA